MTVQESYRILGLPAGAGMDEVKSAFRKLAFETHPDLHGNDPAASRNFQRINEAYLLLRNHLENGGATSGSGATGGSGGPQPRAGREQASRAYASQSQQANRAAQDHFREIFRQAFKDAFKDTFDNQAKDSRGWSRPEKPRAPQPERPKPQARPTGPSAKTTPGGKPSASRTSSDSWFDRPEEVLRDIFQDPYARQVFEDIFAQVSGKPSGGSQPRPPAADRSGQTNGRSAPAGPSTAGSAPRARNPQPPTEALPPRSSGGGISGWFKRQLDVDQTIHMSSAELLPGRTLRLTLHSGLFGKPRQIEVTLPADFQLGKPLRLKGLGRTMVGAKGDMYLRILPSEG